MSDAWLKSVKAGDKIAILGSGPNPGDYSTVTVTRVTPTGRITVTNQNNVEMKFNERGSSMNGGIWSRSYLAPITEEMKKDKRRQNMNYKLSEIKWHELTAEQAEKLYGVAHELGLV